MSLWSRLVRFPLLVALTVSPLLAVANPDPETLVKSSVDKVTQVLRQEKSSFKKEPAKLYKLVDELVLPHFDFERMSRLVLAQNWNTATDAQKARFVTEFRNLIVRTYALSLLDYSNEQVRFLPIRGEVASKRVTVRTEVVKPGSSKAIPIDYDMYLPKDAWKVYDVKVDAVSLVLNYRNSYAEEIRKEGLDTLINSLATKTADAIKVK